MEKQDTLLEIVEKGRVVAATEDRDQAVVTEADASNDQTVGQPREDQPKVTADQEVAVDNHTLIRSSYSINEMILVKITFKIGEKKKFLIVIFYCAFFVSS